ncbi:MAG: phosphoribosylglycinamide formyltransferase, partial [Phycisphaerales bacterium]
MSGKVLRLGVLISGTGRTLENLIKLSRAGELPAEVVVVLSSSPRARGLDFARQAGIRWQVVSLKQLGEEQFSGRISDILREARVDLVCLAGFLKLWRIPPDFEGRVMNIHPALLPGIGGRGYYGHRVHEAVLQSGATESGCTVHFADNEYDHGPIIVQRRVTVLPDDTADTLADRVFEQELAAYPEAIRLYAAGRLRLEGDRVTVLPANR